MLRVVPLAGPAKGRGIEVSEGSTIGRDPDCDVRLVHRSVSRQHARVERSGDAWWVVDDGSRNGVLVDRRKRDRVAFEHGVVVRFGEYPVRLELVPEGSAPAEPAPPVDTAEEVLDEDLDFLEDGEPDEVGLAIEDPADIDLGGRAPARAPTTVPESKPQPTALRELERSELLSGLERDRTGILRGDLTQQPPAVQAAVWIGVLALGGGLAWLVAKLVVGIG